MLDEPTNHLDIQSRHALVEALEAYDGAVVLITHDMHLVQLVADRLWLVQDGTVRTYDGDLADYCAEILVGEWLAAAEALERAGSVRADCLPTLRSAPHKE